MLFLMYILYEKNFISITGYGGEAICLIRVICGLLQKFT